MIEIKNINKSFKHQILFSDFNYKINEGEFVCIYGESGCGKSTLINMIGSLEGLDSGEVTFTYEGKEWSVLKDKKFIRKNIVSYVFQNFALINDETVLNNLLFAMKSVKMTKSEKMEKIREELKNINLLSKINSYVYELSGGEAQRIALVRAVLKPSTVILADEPTGNLDEKNKGIIMKQLQQINKSGKTVVVVTHDLEFKNIADTTLEL